MAKKNRTSQATKGAIVVLLCGAIGVEEFFGHEEMKHIELRQYRATPELAGQTWNIANASTATFTTVDSLSSLLLPEQFT